MKRRSPLIIERGKEIYAGYFPDLPGCTTSGETPEEVSRNAKEALSLYLEDFIERGQPWPDATQAVRMELVEIEESEVLTAVSASSTSRVRR